MFICWFEANKGWTSIAEPHKEANERNNLDLSPVSLFNVHRTSICHRSKYDVVRFCCFTCYCFICALLL